MMNVHREELVQVRAALICQGILEKMGPLTCILCQLRGEKQEGSKTREHVYRQTNQRSKSWLATVETGLDCGAQRLSIHEVASLITEMDTDVRRSAEMKHEKAPMLRSVRGNTGMLKTSQMLHSLMQQVLALYLPVQGFDGRNDRIRMQRVGCGVGKHWEC